MDRSVDKVIRWRAVASGWLVAALAGVAISPLLGALYRIVAGPPAGRGELMGGVVVVSLVSGFLAYLLGGYAAARLSRGFSGLNGATTAVFGLMLGMLLALILNFFGSVFTAGVAVPPACFGLSGSALLAGLILFLFNLFGGYVGGKLGEPSSPDMGRPG